MLTSIVTATRADELYKQVSDTVYLDTTTKTQHHQLIVPLQIMSAQEKNKEVIAKYFTEYWGKLNPGIVDELCSDDFMISYPMHGPKYGKEAAKQMLVDFKAVSSVSMHHFDTTNVR